MKPFLLFFFIAATALALTPEERQVVGEMRDTIAFLRVSLDNANKSNDRVLGALNTAIGQSEALTQRLKVAAEQAAVLTAERDTLSADLSVAKVNYDKLNHRYQTAQLIIALSVAFAVVMLTLQFTHNLTPPYGIIVPIAAGAAAFFGIYIIL